MNEVESIFTLLAKNFCRFPTDLRIKVTESEHSIVVCYTAHADDVRKLIGKRGTMFAALETVLKAVAARRNKRARLIVDEPHTGSPQIAASFEADPTWIENGVRKIVGELGRLLFDGEVELLFNELSSDSSTMLLQISENETWFYDGKEISDGALADALSRIFDSIGRAQGRKLFVEIERRVTQNR